MKIKLICSFCKKEYLKYPSQAINKTNYCSYECHNLSRTTHVYQCEKCNAVFHRPIRKNQIKPRFCSRKCMYVVRKIERNPLNCICKNCGKKFHKTPSQLQNGEGLYCSWDCKKYGSRGSRKEGAHYYSLTNWRELRLKILKRDNYTCVRCGVKPESISKLQVNHIEFRQLGGTDDFSNLETLCIPCHAKTDSEKLKQLAGNDKARMRDYSNIFHKKRG